MKKIIGAALVAVGLLAVGCGDSTKLNKVNTGGTANGPADTTTAGSPSGAVGSGNVVTGTSAMALTVELRMLGTGAEDYSSLMVMANRVEAFADGKPLRVNNTWNAVNLANMQHAEKLATLEVPLGTRNVEFRVSMGAAGGFETATSAGWVDTRQNVISYTTPVAQLAKEGRSVIVVDAKRSFVSRDPETQVFVPQYRIY